MLELDENLRQSDKAAFRNMLMVEYCQIMHLGSYYLLISCNKIFCNNLRSLLTGGGDIFRFPKLLGPA